MKKLIVIATLVLAATSLAGCNTCRSMTGGWFNRGDRCGPPPGCAPGAPQTMMMAPSAPQMLPGAIEITPTN